MIDLRERLQELADAASAGGTTPGPTHAIHRGRQRRRRIITGVASLIIALAVGGASIGHLPDRMVTRPLVPVTPTPTSNLEDTGNAPSRSRLRNNTFRLLATELRRCPGGSSIPADEIGYVWSERYRALLMVAAKQPPVQETRFCWSVGWAGERNPGGAIGASRVRHNDTPLTFTGNIESGFAQIAGRVTRQATRVRLRFRDRRPPMDLEIIQASARYPVNFYAGFFRQDPTSPEQGGWAAATLIALDAAGRTVATCRVGPPGDGTPKCPGN